MTENTTGDLSEAEQAYFDSEGATHFEVEDNAEAQAKTETKAETDETRVLTDEEAQKAIEGKDDDEKGRFVNYGALHKERSQRKELEAEVSGLKQFKAAMEEKMRWTDALLKPQEQKADEDPEPDPNQDIFAHNAWLKRQLESVQNTVASKANEDAKAKEAAAAEQQVWSRWESDSRAYMQENQDFGNAAKWLSDFRDKQLQALSVVDPQFADPRMRNWQIERELAQIVAGSAQAGRSSAQTIYEIAQGYGYQVKAPDPAELLKMPELPGKLKNVEKAQQASRTVGNGSGRTEGADEISIDSLAAMPQGEFNEWMKVPANESRFKKMMGG